MAAISEKIELLGKGLYKDIPNQLTLTSIPTASELDYVGSEDFEQTMIDKILPQSVEEHINFKDLLEIDFQWICRALRILNYGPYYTTNTIFCSVCGKTHHGEYKVNLNSIGCKPLPEGFVNDIVIPKEEFLDFNGDVHLQLPTIQDMINSEKDQAFKLPDGRTNRELARMCYMIKSIKNQKAINPVEIKMLIKNSFSSADYIVLKNKVGELTDYGVRAGGSTKCPKCGHNEAAFIAFVDDRFLKPTLGDLREWKNDRSKQPD